MKRLLTPAEMYRCDRAAMEHTPSRVLMERAAHACADVLAEALKPGERVFVLCGAGNNGGDGLAMARFLTEMGYPADLCIVRDEDRPAGEEWKYQYEAAMRAGLSVVTTDALFTGVYAAAADALFGIGFSRAPEGCYAAAINALNRAGLPVLAVDVPSGVSALDGSVPGCAVKAWKTVTMAYPKPGLYRYPGTLYAGGIHVADIGITDDVLGDADAVYRIEDSDVARLLPHRREDGNKGSFGHVLVIAGSKNMSGAAYFAAKAAYRCGAGLVRILTTEDNRVILQTQLPEAILTTYTGMPDVKLLSECLAWATAVVIGPGIGTGESALSLVGMTLSLCRVPLVVDADALNCIAKAQFSLPKDIPVIMTPHPGEFSRLTGTPVGVLLADLLSHARAYAGEHGIVLAAKDARTVVTDGKTGYLNTSGSSALAKGGSGDVLTGVIAALLACGTDALTAAALGVYIHGRAGDMAAQTWGCRGVLASETADAAALVLRALCEGKDGIRNA